MAAAPATDKQISFFKSLVADKQLSSNAQIAVDAILVNPNSLSKADASWWIDCLLKAPRKVKAAAQAPDQTELPEVPAGRYALHGEESDGEWTFWQVDKPKAPSKWAGYTFLSSLTGAPGDFNRRPVRGANLNAILKLIADRGAEQAAADFGHEHGVCGVCMAKLTDPESIARGIGPQCATKYA